MSRRSRRWDPPLSGPCPNLGPQMTELRSQEELAGAPPLPSVELRPKSPPLQITEAGPLLEPPPSPPFNRDAVLARISVAFARLDDLELEVARRRMLSVPYSSISEELGMLDSEVEQVWKQARLKLGLAMFGGKKGTPNTVQPTIPVPPSSTGTPQESGDTSPV
ncbi:MAG: hypothetical protein L0241_05460 [Planctomycetia bacterium]|nr:hypothetical protein [Planctomycetia bacterium]